MLLYHWLNIHEDVFGAKMAASRQIKKKVYILRYDQDDNS